MPIRVVTAFRCLLLLQAALAIGPGGSESALAQDRPIAGSGQMPAADPFAEAPRNVVEAIREMLGNRAQRNPFNEIKTCFERAGPNTFGQADCRQRLDRYFADVIVSRKDLLGALPPLEVYVRLVALSGDPGGAAFSNDVYGLRGILITLDDAQGFRAVRQCFADAGPQPSIRQICRQRLDQFHTELMREHSVLFRDVDPKLLRKRLYAVADQDNAVFGMGDTTAFDSLRNIRKAQQDKQIEAARELAQAQASYCPPSNSRRLAPLEVQMATDGVCLCSYGRRYLGSNPTVRGRPVMATFASCGPVGRFRVGDLNRGELMHGDWVTLQASHGGYVGVTPNGSVYADRPAVGKFEQFRLVRAGNRPGRIQPGEMVTLISPRGMYVSTNLAGGGELRGTRQPPRPQEYFVLVR